MTDSLQKTPSTPSYEDMLLEGWEDVYRKSQLSMLVLLALKESSKYTAEIVLFMEETTNGLQRTDEQSIYRTLRRFAKADMVRFMVMPSDTGPARKLYSLSDTGTEVLTRFLDRNVISFFYQPRVRKLIERKP